MNPKSACSTTRLFFGLTTGLVHEEDIKKISSDRRKLQDMAIKISEDMNVKIIRNQKYDDYKKILIIRDPYARLVSSFVFLMAGYHIFENLTLPNPEFIHKMSTMMYNCNKNYSSHFPQYPRNLYLPDTLPSDIQEGMINFKHKPSFRNFVKLAEKIGSDLLQHHINSQFNPHHHFILPPSLKGTKFDKIIRVDNLSNELNEIAKSFGKSIQSLKLNSSEYSSSLKINMSDVDLSQYVKQNGRVYPTWEHFYDDELRAIVEKLFYKDLLAYKLSFLKDYAEVTRFLTVPEHHADFLKLKLHAEMLLEQDKEVREKAAAEAREKAEAEAREKTLAEAREKAKKQQLELPRSLPGMITVLNTLNEKLLSNIEKMTQVADNLLALEGVSGEASVRFTGKLEAAVNSAEALNSELLRIGELNKKAEKPTPEEPKPDWEKLDKLKTSVILMLEYHSKSISDMEHYIAEQKKFISLLNEESSSSKHCKIRKFM